MSRISAESFLSLITQSGLVEADRLKREVDDLEDQGCNVEEASALADSLIERDLLTEWQAEKLLRGKHKGFTLGKYRLRRLLGKGGMSSVYLAEHILMRRQCAIKVLPIKRVEDTSYLARFHREARAVASLDHPNIVRAYDIDHESEGEKDIHFLVMEYVDGQSLHEFVKDKGPLPLDDTAEFFRQAALGLENAHKNGLIHRDVKPGNLLIDRSNVVKVLDLGLARFSEVSDDNPLTLAHDEKVLGTADYLAPEQALDSHTADHRADIYGLGCTAYFALTGYPPFREGTLTQRLMFHQTKEPPAIAEERPEVGETKRGIELATIVGRMMAKKPDDRYQTMGEVATAMARWLKIYASPEWRASHQDVFLKSDDNESGGAIPVARAVAVPVAKPISSDDTAPATAVTSGSDTLLQNTASSDASTSETAGPDSSPAAGTPVVPEVPVPEMSTTEAAPDAFFPSNEAAPADQSSAETVDDPGFGAFLAGFDRGEEPAAPAPTHPVPESVSEPQAADTQVAPPVAIPAETETPAGKPVDENQPAPPIASPVNPAAPAEPPAPPQNVPVEAAGSLVEPEPATSSPADSDARDTAVTESNSEDLQGWDDGTTGEEPLAGFDPSILPAPIEQADEYPSLLGGTPTGQSISGLDAPGEVTQSEMEPTGTFVPSSFTPTEPSSDATLLNPAEEPSQANHNIVPSATPVAPSGVPPAETPVGNAPIFPGIPDGSDNAPPMFAAPVAEQPETPDVSNAPMFPGAETAPVQPSIAVEAPSFGAPPASPGFSDIHGQTAAVAARPGKKKPPVAIIAGAVVALVACVGAYFAFTGGDSGEKPKSGKTAGSSKGTSTSAASTAHSSKGKTAGGGGGKFLGPLVKVGPGGDFPTIGAALDYVKKNRSRYDTGSRRTSCKIEVNGGETFSETIIVDNSSKAYPPGVQIVSSGVGRARLTPSGSGPAIRLVGLENWLVQGFDVDASGKDVAIELSGYLNRTSLKDLNVSGFKNVGVLLKGAIGFSNDEVVLEDLILRGSGGVAAGIHFAKDENGASRVKVLNCQLSGPQDTGILFETDVTYVEMRENIIANAGVGIAFTEGPLTLKDVQILNTTFYKCSRGGVVISHMPVPAGGIGGSGGLAIHRNLFAQVNGPELLIENDFDDKKFDQYFSTAGAGVDQNWSDRQQPADINAGQREIISRDQQRVPSIEFASTDASSPDFLSLKKNTPYARVGGAKLRTKPYVGARPAK